MSAEQLSTEQLNLLEAVNLLKARLLPAKFFNELDDRLTQGQPPEMTIGIGLDVLEIEGRHLQLRDSLERQVANLWFALRGTGPATLRELGELGPLHSVSSAKGSYLLRDMRRLLNSMSKTELIGRVNLDKTGCAYQVRPLVAFRQLPVETSEAQVEEPALLQAFGRRVVELAAGLTASGLEPYQAAPVKEVKESSHPAPQKPSSVDPIEELDEPFFETDEEEEWQERALCAQTDPEIFFPEKGGSTKEAKQICQACGVRAECLDYALKHDERFGVWGGLSERQRRKLKEHQTSSP